MTLQEMLNQATMMINLVQFQDQLLKDKDTIYSIALKAKMKNNKAVKQ